MAQSTCLAIGNFDGVHLGHQVLIQQTIRAARELNGQAVVLTFDPHPSRILAPDRSPPLLLTLDRKQELLTALGVDRIVIQPFDRPFSQKTPRDFIEDVLAPLYPRQVFVGTDFCFGYKRAGTIETLALLGQEFGFTTQGNPLVELDQQTVSSSRVRQALTDGNLPLVQGLLGRPFDFDGVVVTGDQRGRTIGFPTANLRTQTEALPKHGAYAVRVTWSDEGHAFSANGMMNIGTRPTFTPDSTVPTIEVHLFDINQDLYGKTLRVACMQRLRDEQKFETIEELREQLQRDEVVARALLGRTF